MGYSPRGCKELDTTERLHFHFSQFGTSPLFHVLFLRLFLDLHTDFSGGSKVVWYSDLFKNIPQFVMIYTKVLA